MEKEATIVSLSATSSPDHHAMPSAQEGLFYSTLGSRGERRKKEEENGAEQKNESRKPE